MPIDDQLLRDVFSFFDQDNSGSIDKTEFFLAMQKLGISTKAEDVDRLFCPPTRKTHTHTHILSPSR